MGQKIHPGGLRVGVIHDWKSNWYTGKKEFADYILEDVRIREHINGKLSHAGLSDILIRKDKQRITVDIYTARPGIVIGKSGVEVDALRKELHAITGKSVHININEIKRPELDAQLVAQSIAEQLQNRVSFRRAMKRALASAMRSGAQGIKIQCGGRLGGGEMSRSSATPRVACRCTRSAPTSTTASPRRRRRTVGSASRSGSTRARSCRRATRAPRPARRRASVTRIRHAASAAALQRVSAPRVRAAAAAARIAKVSASSRRADVARAAAGRRRRRRRPPGGGRARGRAAARRGRRADRVAARGRRRSQRPPRQAEPQAPESTDAPTPDVTPEALRRDAEGTDA